MRTIGACVDLRQSQFCQPTAIDADVRVTTGPDDAHQVSASRPCAAASISSWHGAATAPSTAAASASAGHGRPARHHSGRIRQRPRARSADPARSPRRPSRSPRPGPTRAIDAGELHGSLFFNVAGVGFDARIADRLAEPGARRGLLGYVDRDPQRAAQRTSRAAIRSTTRLTSTGRRLTPTSTIGRRCSSRSPTRVSTATARRSRRRRCSTMA